MYTAQLLCTGLGYPGDARSIFTSPGYQQPWNWQCQEVTCRSDFNKKIFQQCLWIIQYTNTKYFMPLSQLLRKGSKQETHHLYPIMCSLVIEYHWDQRSYNFVDADMCNNHHSLMNTNEFMIICVHKFDFTLHDTGLHFWHWVVTLHRIDEFHKCGRS